MPPCQRNEDPFYGARLLICTDLLKGFFAAEDAFKVKVIDDLVTKNNKLLEWSWSPNCFQFRTTIYRHSSLSSFNQIPKFTTGIPVMHPDLEPVMLKLIADWERLECDRQKLKQLLGVLLKPCVSAEQVRNAVPEFLVRHSQVLSRYSRRSEPFELESRLSPAQWDDYNHLLPRLHAYNGAALLI